MRKFALLISAAAVLVSTAAFAQKSELDYMREDLNLPPKFDSETLRSAAGERAVNRVSKQYGVGTDFTEADIIARKSQSVTLDLRKRYSLAPNFTCSDLRRAVGAQVLAHRMEQYKLPSGFTEADLIRAYGLEELRFSDGIVDNAEPPKSSVELGYRRADQRLQEAAKDAGLTGEFTYLQYREAVGPTKAGYLRSHYGFGKSASYQEMKEAIARKQREEFAGWRNVSVDWTLDNLVVQLGQKRLEQLKKDLKITGPADEAALAEAYANRDFTIEVPSALDGASCNEADIARARGESTASWIRSEFDLDAGFTAADVRESAGLSVIAKVRRLFGLTGKFTNEDLEKAQARIDENRKLVPRGPDSYLYPYGY